MTDEPLKMTMGLGTTWDWFYGLACECVAATGRDFDRAVEMMVERILDAGNSRAILRNECRAYIHTAMHREELDEMEPEEVIEKGLSAGIKDGSMKKHGP